MKTLRYSEEMSHLTITQPNQAFTPRQILEQFARNEVIPSEYQPSDNIDDSNTSEESMVNDVIEFEDKIDAENHLIENQYALQHEADQGQQASGEGSSQAPEEVTSTSGSSE